MSNDARTVAPYGSWPSPVTVEALTARTVRLAEVAVDGDATFWVEGRPDEGGRRALVRADHDGSCTDVVPTTLPDGSTFDVGTRVHEYGGGSFAVTADGVVVSRSEDGRLFRVDRTDDGWGAPVPLVPADGRRYADLEVDPGRGLLFAVCEDHGEAGAQLTDPRTTLVVVPLDGSAAVDASAVRDVVTGSDFVAAPRLSPDGSRLAWISWEHPAMPWDATTLHVATLADDGTPTDAVVVAGGPWQPDVSVLEPTWTTTGDLVHVDDRTGWWNLFRTELAASGPRTRPLHPVHAEFTTPLWNLGQRTLDVLDADDLVASWSADGQRSLGTVSLANGVLERWDGPWQPAGSVRAAPGRVVFLGVHPSLPASVVEVRLPGGTARVLRSSSDPSTLDPAAVSLPRPVSWDVPGGEAHGLVHLPLSRTHTGPDDELPPLLVLTHGGPTSAVSAGLSLDVQWWTSRGFAVLAVDYGGSTGYGRAYRERLRGAWGEVDVADCAAGARELAARGLVDGARLAIRGWSAGGFTTLAALTSTDVFAAGASHFGVSDLEALARDTHKFESRYLDGLVGPYPEARELYVARSPLHHTDRLGAPMILFQGTEDRVVPPAQAELMAAAVAAKGLEAELVLLEGEGHGFRQAASVQRVAAAELAFYGRVFGFDPA